jgi:hypothetical protein
MPLLQNPTRHPAKDKTLDRMGAKLMVGYYF